MSHGPEYPPGQHPARWRALMVCLAAGFMTLLDVSIVNVALPSIQTGLRASASDLQWVLSGYALTFGLVLVPAGRLGDATGRRVVFLAGVGLFTLASVSAGLAVSPAWLSVSRLVQGVAGGLINPQVAGLIQELFRSGERNQAFGWLGASIGVATAAGPVIGGLIIALAGAQHGWRWVFLVNLPVGLATIVLGLRWLPAGRAEHRVRGLDLTGVVLLGLGVLLVMLPMLEAEGGRPRVPWWLVGLGLLVLAVFVGWEHRCRGRGGSPLVAPELMRSRGYTLGVLVGMVYFASFTGIFFVLAVFFQRGLGYSALASGLAVTTFALGSAVAAAVGGRVVSRSGRLVVVIGLMLVVVGLASTDLVFRHWHSGYVAGVVAALPLLLAGVGSGLTVSPNQALTLAAVPVRMAGTAAGVLQTGQRIGTAVGIAGMGLAFYGTLASTGSDYGRAVTTALWLAVGLALLALLFAVVDLLLQRQEPAAQR